jgi:hypothetical protein
MKLKCSGRSQWCQKEECSVTKGHNQPASDGSNNVLDGESNRPTMGPMCKLFIKTTTIVVAFTWGAFTGISDW